MTDLAETTASIPALRRPNRLARAVNRLSSPATLPDALARGHRWLYLRTDGRIGHGLIGAPSLLLHTLGRRSGQRRTTPVVYVPDRDRLVVCASNGGASGRPAWFHNLLAAPTVELQVGRHRLTAMARVMDDSDPDYSRLWEALNRSTNGRLDVYRERASRPIPLVALTPIG